MAVSTVTGHHRFPPTEAISVLADAIWSVQQRGDRAEIDLEELEQAQEQVNAYLAFRERKFKRQQVDAARRDQRGECLRSFD